MKDYFGFSQKTVVVTGASSGMGEAAGKMLVDLGAKVYAVGNRKQIAYSPEQALYADLSEKEALDGLIARLPERIDALFICQGIAQGLNPDLLVQKVNFLSVRYLAETLAPRIADNGSITIISSNGGFGWEKAFDQYREVLDCQSYEETVTWYERHPDRIKNAYVFSKWCLNAYTKYKVFDPVYIGRKIRLNCICPGNTITGLTDDFNRSINREDPDAGRRLLEQRYQARWNGRWASAEEMGWPMVAIGSQMFSYMSGQVIYFDYGITSAWEMDAMAGQPPS